MLKHRLPRPQDFVLLRRGVPWSAIGMLVFLLGAAAPARATSLVNLLQNPSAEQQPVTNNGWTQASGDWSIPRGDDDGLIGTRTGANFFWGGQSAAAELYQEVDLTGYRAWLGDDGSRAALFVGYRGSWSGDDDSSRVVVEARDAAGAVLWTADSGAASPDTWSRVEMKVVLPAGSARIRVRLLTTRVSGADNNGYFDDVGLYLPPPNLLINPGAELQPVTSNGWIATGGDWSIPRGNDSGGIGTHSGANFFWGGQADRTALSQIIYLDRYRGWIGDGTRTIQFTGYIGSFSGDDDEGTLEFQFFSEKEFLGGSTFGPVSPDSWQRFSQTLMVPPATYFIRVLLIAQRRAGADNNAYFDDLGVYLPAHNLLVNPGAERQPVTTNGWEPLGNGNWTIPRGDDEGGIGTHSGYDFFWAGQEPLGSIRQTYDVTPYRGWLGNGAQSARLIGYKGSWSGDGDTSQLQFLAQSIPFDFDTYVDVYDVASSPDAWTRSELVLQLPEWVEQLAAYLLSVRVSGLDNNGYFDDLHLQFDAPDAIFDSDGVLRDGFEGAGATSPAAEEP